MTAVVPVMSPPMGAPTIGVFDFLGTSIRPEAEAWAGAVRANGGVVVNEDVAIVSAFIAAEDAAGAWALTDDYLGFWAPNETQARVSIKQRRLMTLTGSPTFTANRDYAFNGSSQHGDTGFIPATHGVNCTGTSQAIAVYERTNVASAGGHGTLTTSTSVIFINPRNAAGTAATCRFNSVTVPSFTLSPADSRGLKEASRVGNTNQIMRDRGVRLTDASGGTPGTSAPTHSLYIGAFNNAGSPSGYRASSVGFFAVGGPLSSDAMGAARYANVQAWATIRGAQV